MISYLYFLIIFGILKVRDKIIFKESIEEEEEEGSKLNSTSSSAKSSSPKVLEPSEDERILIRLTLICDGITNGILSLN